MVLPFLYPLNYLPVTDTLYTPGTITMENIGTYSTVDGSTTSMEVTIFAHMTEVELVAPTTFLPSSMPISSIKDEFSEPGALSTKATAVAAAAGLFKEVPGIGKYAKATEMAATSVAELAALLGYSRPINLMPRNWIRNGAMFSLGNSDADDNAEQLALTMKTELSIDPSTVGAADSRDFLDFSVLAQHPSYVGQFEWNITDTPSTPLTTISIAPYNRGFGNERISTPAGYIMQNFEYWSGTMIYDFHVIASQMTRGILAFVYEPKNDNFVAEPEALEPFNTNYIATLDISVSRSIQIRIPWMQEVPYKGRASGEGFPYNGYPTNLCNGSILVYVINDLRQPNGSVSPVDIWVSARGGDDFEVGALTPYYAFNSAAIGFIPSSELVPGETQAEDPVSVTDTEDPTVEARGILTASHADTDSRLVLYKPLVFFGESIRSFRSLLKRYYFWRAAGYGSTDPMMYMDFTAFPWWRSPSSLGGGPDSGGQYYCNTTPLHMCAVMFAGWRGSIKWKLDSMDDTTNSIYVTRANASRSTPWTAATGVAATLGSSLSATTALNVLLTASGSGYARSVKQAKQLEFTIPYMENMRFSQVPSQNISLEGEMGSKFRVGIVSSVGNTGTNKCMEMHVAAGEDFQYFGFNGVPPRYVGIS